MGKLYALAALAAPLFVSAQPDYLAGQPIWTVSSQCAVPAPCIATETYNYWLCGDTVLGGMDHRKVCRTGTGELQWMAPPPIGCSGSYGIDAYHAAIRQDAFELHIWDGTTDQLLYDFDLEVGDTLPISFNNWNPDITVVAVDSVPIAGDQWKRFELANSWAQFLIEGIGSSHGLTEPLSDLLECGYTLDCYGQGDSAFYPFTGATCELATGVTDLSPTDQTITVSFDGWSGITLLTDGPSPIDRWRFLDMAGRVVATANVLPQALRVDLPAPGRGAWIVEATFTDGARTALPFLLFD